MLFDRFRRSSSSRTPRFAFYGKLPFDREFLRYHLDSPEGRWITNWVHGAHEFLAARREAGGVVADSGLRAAIACERDRAVLAAVLRPSSDGGGRSYPACAFAVIPAVALDAAWHLTPLWLEPVWELMENDVLARPTADRREFGELLARQEPEPAEATAIAARFARSAATPIPKPWETLTAAGDAQARKMGVTFVQLGRVQRTAGNEGDGIVVRLPLAPTNDPTPMLRAALWLRLYSAVAGFQSPWPAVIAVAPNSVAEAPSLCVFGREPTAADLADLLSGAGTAPIDNLADTWDSEPEAEEDRRRLGALVDDKSTCWADLWQRMD